MCYSHCAHSAISLVRALQYHSACHQAFSIGDVPALRHSSYCNLQVRSSSLAITVAQVACPTAGSAQVAAIAIATAAISDGSVASSAIAGVLTAGVDVTACFVQASYLPMDQRK
jgi:hypothetical protein